MLVKKRQRAFILAEAMLALSLVTAALVIEQQQVHAFLIAKAKLKAELQQVEQEKCVVLDQWHECMP